MVCQSRNVGLCFIDVSFLFGLRTGMVGDKDGGGGVQNDKRREEHQGGEKLQANSCRQILQ